MPVDLVALAEWLAAEYCSTVARALRLVLPPARPAAAPPASACASAARARSRARGSRRPAGCTTSAPLVEPRRADRRSAARVAGIGRALAGEGGPRPAALLLHGITGSGKTEVYLRAAACALQRGRGAIVLVPEIALTPQIVGRFVGRFGETVAVLHSRLTPAQRREEWRRLRTGEARVCVGPRSAVFAPIEGLGLIVVDEEHDSSYKHEGDPRYDAREVAANRAALQGALLLLGSATPRPESHHALARVCLPRRVDGRPLPPVELLDMREQSHGAAPRRPPQALADVRREGGKAIVLLNRRGWSNFLSCAIVREGVELPAVRRGARVAPQRGAGSLPPLRSRRARAGALRLRLDGGGAPRRGHRAAAARAACRAGRRRALSRSSGWTPTRSPPARAATAWARCCAASGRPRRAC